MRHSYFIPCLLLGVLLASCAKKAPRQVEANVPEANELRIVVEHDHIPEAVIALFEKETGIKVHREIIQSEWGELADLLNAFGRNDLFLFDDWAINGLRREGKLEPIDHAAVPNLKNIAPEFLNLPIDPGNQYSVPYLGGVMGILVNTDLVKQDVKTFQDVFNPKFAGKIWVENSQNNLVEMAWMAGHVTPLNGIAYETLDAIGPTLRKWLSYVRILANRTPMEHFTKGEVSLGILWSGQAGELMARSPKYRWIVPAGTTYCFIDSFAMPKGCAQKAKAEAFINFLLRPDVGKIIAESAPYASPNAAARALIPAATLEKNPAAFPPYSVFRRMSLTQESAKEQLMIDEWFPTLLPAPVAQPAPAQ